MIIEVTQEDITEGQVGHCQRCPVARAVLRALDNKYNVSVTSERITFYKLDSFKDEDKLHRVLTPLAVHDFIENFDWSRKVQPLSFELDLTCLSA